MSRALKILVVVALMAVLPARAMAGVTIGFCASGHKDMAVHAGHVSLGGGTASHASSNPAPADKQPFSDTCSICAEHCSSAAFATASDPTVGVQPTGNDQTFLAARNAPPFVPDQPDRPPLA